ncbi:MAG: hypothetical protein H7Y89_07995 [Steroidobacteraceae bacterium]|nr:hypothetical protein [Steroidobacteraceae bacterium]
MTTSRSVADTLNRECDCTVVNAGELNRGLESAVGGRMLLPLTETHPHLFSEAPVFVDHRHAGEMRSLVETVYRVAAIPEYVAAVMSSAPAIAQIPQTSLGAFNGFDFHITPEGPRLIEINTNAGGAMLNVFARALHSDCCPGVPEVSRGREDAARIESEIVAMFHSEWRQARPDGNLSTLAIVDDAPEAQFLYPEFLLFQRMLESNGIQTLVVDPSALELTEDGLFVAGRRIDLVYNRLTDFYLEDPRHQVLKDAYESGAAVVTPHPRAHALLASKRILSLLSDSAFLKSVRVGDSDIATLTRLIPRTLLVEGAEERWWTERKQWFFKPLNGFGSRGAYRGDKITRRVFAEVVRGGYVAQELSPPGERLRSQGDQPQTYKIDIRAYVYEARTQMLAARLYQGQTTNFRTAGGGFAPVFELGADSTPGQVTGCG